MKKVVGVDYSLTGPAVCVYDDFDGDFKFENCRFYFMTNVKSLEGKQLDNVWGKLFPDYNGDEERYHNISGWAIDAIFAGGIPNIIGVEGYSMGSKGRVFNLAENCGILKYRIWRITNSDIFDSDMQIYPPTVIKKFATGKGNANKEAMYDAFVNETGVHLKDLLTPNKSKIDSPVSDIVDAYYICKYAHSKLK